MANTLISSILQESIFLFLIIGSLLALLLGLLFLLSPKRGRELTLRYNRWHSLRRPTRALEVTHSVEKTFYHHHQVVGLFILLSASYILYRFAFDFDFEPTLHALKQAFGNATISEWLLEAALWFTLPITALLLLFGATMALKPSALRGIEHLANRWVSTRKLMQPLEKQHFTLDNWVQQHPHTFGIVLILLAGYNLSTLLIFFINRVH